MTALPHPPPELVAHHFETAEQQKDSATLGMWTFLATEILFFGGVFMAYIIYRWLYHDAFAEASRFMDVAIGGINTAVLLTSSLMMALAVHAAREGRKQSTTLFLALTLILGLAFLGIKAYEWNHKWIEHLVPGLNWQYAGTQPSGRVEMFFILYFILTGLHAVHMTIGIGILGGLIIMNARGKFSASRYAPVEISGLYWHFVDIVWIFLYPLLYLIRTH